MDCSKTAACFGVRHIQVMLLFWILAITYGMRVILSVGIIAMTDPSVNPDFPTYDWSTGLRTTMLSSFFWGYVIPQIHAGQLSEKYGPKWLLTGTMIVGSLFTALIPPMAAAGSWGVFVCRIIQGFTQGFVFPATHYLLSKWVPPSERSRMGSFVYAGGSLGTVITLPVTGWLCASSLGWPSVFYLYAAVGFIWSGLFIWFGCNKPSDHKTMTADERKYLESSMGASNTEKKYSTPWIHLAKSLPFWGLLLAYSGQDFGYWMLNTQIPSFMNGVLNFDIQQNGLLSAAPYLALWLVSLFFSAMSDFLVNRGILTVNVARKTASGIGMMGPAVALIVLGALGEPQRGSTVALLIVAVGLNGAIFSGQQVNHMDLSPTHAATLMGITNCVSNVCSILAVLLVQVIVSDETNADQWMIVFYIAAGVYIVTDLCFTIFGRTDVQYWDKLEDNDEESQTQKRIAY